MMIRVVLTGWRDGLRKLELTKEMRALPAIQGLAQAKGMTDALLDGETVLVSFDSIDAAESFLDRAYALGADGHIEAG